MKKKFYFEELESEMCYSEVWFQEHMRFNNIIHMKVFTAVQIKDESAFWCKRNSECGSESSEQCGVNNCNDYEPRNGKSGCCKHYSKILFAPGDEVTLKFKR